MTIVIDKDTGKEFPLFDSGELKAERNEFWAINCEHKEMKLGLVAYSNGSEHVRKVCTNCGEFIGDTLKRLPEHDSLERIEQQSLRQKYHQTRESTWNEILQKHIRLQKRGEAGFQLEYARYLSSSDWRSKREKVLKRANFKCEGCLERPATLVHHLQYSRIYREMMFDLVALCKTCHAACHPEKTESDASESGYDDLPCFACRHFAGYTNDGAWCGSFKAHVVIALADKNLCGPQASSFEELK